MEKDKTAIEASQTLIFYHDGDLTEDLVIERSIRRLINYKDPGDIEVEEMA